MGLVLWQMLNIVAEPGYRGITNHRYVLQVRVDGLGSQSGVGEAELLGVVRFLGNITVVVRSGLVRLT